MAFVPPAFRSIVLPCLIAFAFADPVMANLIFNGSFETGFSSWAAEGNVLVAGILPSTPTDGAHLAVFNSANTQGGSLTQGIPTVPGQYYTLRFDAGVYAFNNLEQRLNVRADGLTNRLTWLVSQTGTGGGQTVWHPQVLGFKADSTLTTLTFHDQSTSTSNIDLLLDNIRVTQGVPPGTPPVATADTYATRQDNQLALSPGLLANDIKTDPNALGLLAYLDTDASHGTVTVIPDGSAYYTPDAGFHGIDTFTYHTSDGMHDSEPCTVTLLVTPHGEVANGSFEHGLTGWTASGHVTALSGAPYVTTDGSKLAVFNSVNSARDGVLSQQFYLYRGETYQLDLDAGALGYNTNFQKMRVRVYERFAKYGGYSLLLAEEVIDIQAPGGGGTTWVHKQLSFNSNGDVMIFFEDLSTTTTNIDLVLDKVRLTLTSVPVNTVPVGVPDSYVTHRGVPLVVPAATGVLANDTDAQGDPLTALQGLIPGHGSFSIQPDGGFTYTPDPNYHGPDNFLYYVSDGPNMASALVELKVLPPSWQQVSNGNFEAGLAGGWLTTSGITTEADDHGTHLLIPPSGGVLNLPFQSIPGHRYQLTFKAAARGTTTPQGLDVALVGQGAYSPVTYPIPAVVSGIEWHAVTYEHVADSDLLNLYINPSIPAPGMEILLDDIRIVDLTALEATLATCTFSGPPGEGVLSLQTEDLGTFHLESSPDLQSWTKGPSQTITTPGPVTFPGLPGPAGGDPAIFHRVAVEFGE